MQHVLHGEQQPDGAVMRLFCAIQLVLLKGCGKSSEEVGGQCGNEEQNGY